MKKLIFMLLLILLVINCSAPALTVNEASSKAQPPDVISETAVLIDANTGQVLYQKDMDKRMYPASITKIMTALLALKYGNLNDIVTMSHDAVASVDSDSANIALSSGEQITLEQALYAISVASANDAANGIAELIGGTKEKFIEMMNSEARELGAAGTHFVNANGLPDENHYTTAHDMALITAEALNMPGFSEIFSTKRYKILPTNKQPETRILNSSNRLINEDMPYDGILMSKVGWTNEAQHTLVTAARRNDTTLIAVVMKAADSTAKWTDTVSLLDYGFQQFTPVMMSAEDILQAAPADLTLQGKTDVQIDPDTYAASDIPILLPEGFSLDDVQFIYGTPQPDTNGKQVRIPVRLNLPFADTTGISSELAETTVNASLQSVSQVPEKTTVPASPKVSILKIILIIFVSIIAILALAFIFLVIRRSVIIRRRKRRKRLARRR